MKLLKIGVDLGGSHIGVGLIHGDEIIVTRDHNFKKEDRLDIENTIITYTENMINDILNEKNISIDNIETIGIASPRTNFKRFDSKSF